MIQELLQLNLSRATVEQFLFPLALSWGSKNYCRVDNHCLRPLFTPTLIIPESKAKTLAPQL